MTFQIFSQVLECHKCILITFIPFPKSPSSHGLPTHTTVASLHFFLLFYDLGCPYILRYEAFQGKFINLPRMTVLYKTDSPPPPRNSLLSITLQLQVDFIPMLYLHAEVCSGLRLHRPSACCHSHCEFVYALPGSSKRNFHAYPSFSVLYNDP